MATRSKKGKPLDDDYSQTVGVCASNQQQARLVKACTGARLEAIRSLSFPALLLAAAAVTCGRKQAESVGETWKWHPSCLSERKEIQLHIRLLDLDLDFLLSEDKNCIFPLLPLQKWQQKKV